MKKKYIKLVLVFVIAVNASAMLTGCTFSSLLFSSRKQQNVVIIDYPPNRIAYGGSMTDRDNQQILNVLAELRKRKYSDHKYKRSISVEVDSNIAKDYNHKTGFSSNISTKKRIKK